MSYSPDAYYSVPPNEFKEEIKINSPTGSEIVTVSDFKDYARVDTSADDTLIGNMIEQARIWCENYISKDIVAKNRTYYLPWTNKRFALPFVPLSSISTLTVEGSAADYETKGIDESIIELNELPAQEIKVTYITAGMNDGLLQQAILQLASTYYENRADYIVLQGVSFVQVPSDVKSILNSYKSVYI
jgi:hypothetical protein